MESQMNDSDAGIHLASVIAIISEGNLLYRIRLSLHSSGHQNRKRFHNPLLMSFIIFVSILKSLTAILMKEHQFFLL
jgi:hypothetical protein